MDRMTRRLVGNTDAEIWAEEFVRLMETKPEIATDRETMVGWFANAIMAGHDEVKNREVFAIGWLSAHFAALADAWEGNAPDWFPQPPEWLELWERALDETQEVAAA
jgi:hypothetical protein